MNYKEKKRKEMVRRHNDIMEHCIEYGKRGDDKNRDGAIKEYLKVAKQGGMKFNAKNTGL